jgi:hypothetical protein
MLGEKYHDEHDQFDHLHVSSRSVAFDEEYTLGQELGTGAMSVVRRWASDLPGTFEQVRARCGLAAGLLGTFETALRTSTRALRARRRTPSRTGQLPVGVARAQVRAGDGGHGRPLGQPSGEARAHKVGFKVVVDGRLQARNNE